MRDERERLREWVVRWLDRRAEQFPAASKRALDAVGGGPIGAGKVKAKEER